MDKYEANQEAADIREAQLESIWNSMSQEDRDSFDSFEEFVDVTEGR